MRVFSRDPIRGKLTNRGKPRYLRAGGVGFIQFRFRFLGIKGMPRRAVAGTCLKKNKKKKIGSDDAILWTTVFTFS